MNDPAMRNIQGLYDMILAEKAVSKVVQRGKRQGMLESELVEFRPDFWEAKELAISLQCAIAARMNVDHDELPENLMDAFKQLEAALTECDQTGPL